MTKLIVLLALQATSALAAEINHDNCAFRVANFDTVYEELKDEFDSKKQILDRQIQEEAKGRLQTLGKGFIGQFKGVAEAKAVLQRNEAAVTLARRSGVVTFPERFSYEHFAHVLRSTMIAETTPFRPIGKPEWSHLDDRFGRTHYDRSEDNSIRPEQLVGELVVGFLGYEAFAGVVVKFDDRYLFYVDPDGVYTKIEWKGPINGLTHLHVFDSAQEPEQFIVATDKILAQTTLQQFGRVRFDLMLGNWQTTSPNLLDSKILGRGMVPLFLVHVRGTEILRAEIRYARAAFYRTTHITLVQPGPVDMIVPLRGEEFVDEIYYLDEQPFQSTRRE